MTPKHQMMACWYAVLTFMFFSLYGFEATRVLAHFIGADRADAIEWTPLFVVVGALFALTAGGIVVLLAHRDFD